MEIITITFFLQEYRNYEADVFRNSVWRTNSRSQTREKPWNIFFFKCKIKFWRENLTRSFTTSCSTSADRPEVLCLSSAPHFPPIPYNIISLYMFPICTVYIEWLLFSLFVPYSYNIQHADIVPTYILLLFSCWWLFELKSILYYTSTYI